MTKLDDAQPDIVDAAMAQWWQGDCVLSGEHWFVHRVSELVHQTTELLESEVAGFVVLTQCCDIRRCWRDRPLIAVAPLVPVKSEDLRSIQQGHRPAYAYVPCVADRMFVADLDRIMTVDKSVVANWDRISGFRTDSERREFALAVARKHSRFAFPDDFSKFVDPLRIRLREKHNRISTEGETLQALRQIRVRAAPSWDASDIELMFWFIRRDASTPLNAESDALLKKWLALVQRKGRFNKVFGQIVTFADLTAADYLESDPLDLDQLSTGM